MNYDIDSLLASELQQLYLLNTQWLSEVMFLENESRFFRRLFNKNLSSIVTEGGFGKLRSLDMRLHELEESRNRLGETINSYQHTLEAVTTDKNKNLGFALIAENESANQELKSRISTNKRLKSEMYTLVAAIIRKDKNTHLNSNVLAGGEFKLSRPSFPGAQASLNNPPLVEK